MQELLRSENLIAVCDTSVKNGALGACWMIMTREKEELMNREIRANDWGFNDSKTAEAVVLLYLIQTLRKNHTTLIKDK